jgi:transposase
MNYNVFLLRLGLDPSQFTNRLNEPIKTEKGWLYEVDQKTDGYRCPYCRGDKLYIHDYNIIEINCRESSFIEDVLRVRKVRLRCKACRKTFTPDLRGLDPGFKTSSQTLQLIYSEFTGQLTFAAIGKRYGLSSARVMQIFDEKITHVPRRPLPEVLCLDEIRFSKDKDRQYVCILYDFFRREIVDVIKNRRMPYLREYFNKINPKELAKVKFVISDMYDAYATITHHYFKNAVHIVDLFHVIRLLTTAINQLRVRTMNLYATKGTAVYNFMKQHWKLFLCRTNKIPDRFYTHQKSKWRYHFDELLRYSLQLNSDLHTAYNILQDLFMYDLKFTYDEALLFVKRITDNLRATNSPLLHAVGNSYHKWRFEIASSFSYSQNKIRYTNAIAENINNQIKTITKAAYGYKNFDRFRKRIMLIITYKKRP